jgi:hypothetical protein
MAIRLNLRHSEMIRRKIQVKRIVDILQHHIDGKNDLSRTQIKAAEILLAKSMSNAPQITEHSGLDGGPIEMAWPIPKNSLD